MVRVADERHLASSGQVKRRKQSAKAAADYDYPILLVRHVFVDVIREAAEVEYPGIPHHIPVLTILPSSLLCTAVPQLNRMRDRNSRSEENLSRRPLFNVKQSDAAELYLHILCIPMIVPAVSFRLRPTAAFPYCHS